MPRAKRGKARALRGDVGQVLTDRRYSVERLQGAVLEVVAQAAIAGEPCPENVRMRLSKRSAWEDVDAAAEPELPAIFEDMTMLWAKLDAGLSGHGLCATAAKVRLKAPGHGTHEVDLRLRVAARGRRKFHLCLVEMKLCLGSAQHALQEAEASRAWLEASCAGGGTWQPPVGGPVLERACGFLGVSRTEWRLRIEEKGMPHLALDGRLDWRGPGAHEPGARKRKKSTPGAWAEQECEPKRRATTHGRALHAADARAFRERLKREDSD